MKKIIKRNKERFSRLFKEYKSHKELGYELMYIDFFPIVRKNCRYVYPKEPAHVSKWWSCDKNLEIYVPNANFLNQPSLLAIIELMNIVKSYQAKNYSHDEIKETKEFHKWKKEYELYLEEFTEKRILTEQEYSKVLN